MYLHQNLPNCGAVCQTNPLSLYTTAVALLLLCSLGILVIGLNKQTNKQYHADEWTFWNIPVGENNTQENS